MKRIIFVTLLSSLIATVSYSYTITHPKLQDAYNLTDQAIKDISEAYHSKSGGAFGGHAESAVDALKKAQNELVEADKWNDAHEKQPKQQPKQ